MKLTDEQTTTLRRQIFAQCRELGLDRDARHGMQMQVTGKASLTDMRETDLLKVVSHLKQAGAGTRPGGKKMRPPSKHGGVRFIHVLWRLLGEAGELEKPGREGLNKFIRSRFSATWGATLVDVDALRDHDQISDVINALKAWCHRAGIELEE
ncbi:regulatory protein GemA [Phaeobacter sp. PT47_59]|uniref:regulatory protein GemA n=1 Tax=Phaeobacter sp. PT47_59 TaxID=3029979 RepID=UPI0023801C56|nr:regulatory protein GemA [Phaeobacter sp. PT47_59]MDE4175782.1 regulatory protein GemA [Phaeobacter sp. PT47_59]